MSVLCYNIASGLMKGIIKLTKCGEMSTLSNSLWCLADDVNVVTAVADVQDKPVIWPELYMVMVKSLKSLEIIPFSPYCHVHV